MPKANLELKIAILKRGLRQKDVADLLAAEGVDVREYDISKFVTGRYAPPPEVQEKLARLLEMPKDQLFPAV